MEEKERYYYKEYAGDYDILDRNDKNAYYGAISRDEEDAQNLINLLNQQDKKIKELEHQLYDIRQKDVVIHQNCRQIYIKDLEEKNNLVEENKQLKEKLNNFETCMKKYNVEDIEHLDLMLFVLSGETKYHLKEIKDKYKTELEQSQKQLAIEELKLALENFRNRPTYFDVARQELCLNDQDKQFIDFINNRIKELDGGKNDHNRY